MNNPGDTEIKFTLDSSTPIISLTPYSLTNSEITSSNVPNNTDLIPGKYEGGLKIWECSLDLLNFITEKYNSMSLSLFKVLELGCGHGFPGIYFALKQAALTVFQDFNKEVLEKATKQYFSQLKEKYNVDLISKCLFVDGDWGSFTSDVCFDVILSADTLYNIDNYEKIYNVIKMYLNKGGVAYFATKKFYFGVGGGALSFYSYVMNKNEFEVKIEKEINNGISNIRNILSIKWK